MTTLNSASLSEALHAEKSVAELGLITSASGIFKTILTSKNEGKFIAIKAEQLGTKPLIVAVDDIVMGNLETTVLLTVYDNSGYLIPAQQIDLLSIQAVYPLPLRFKPQ